METSVIEAHLRPLPVGEQPCTKDEFNYAGDLQIDPELETRVVDFLNTMLERRIIIESSAKRKPKPPRSSSSSFKLIRECHQPLNSNISRLDSTSKLVKRPKLAIDYLSRAAECSVDSNWVMSTVNTKFWCDGKKSRLLCVSTLKRWSNGRIECEVIK